MRTILVTGGAGFIGSNFCHYLLRHYPDYRVVVLDALTYAGNYQTFRGMASGHPPKRTGFYVGRIQDETVVDGVFKIEKPALVVNFAAESHNDRSILDAGSFIQTDVAGVYTLLEATRRHGVERMLHVSTDEVYGSVDEGRFTEAHPLEPNTPYSASKAGGEMLVRAHRATYGTNVVVTRCGNNFGPWQYPEKLIPFFVTRLMDGKKVPLYGSGLQVRDWVYVEDHCSGIDHVLHYGAAGEVYNIGSDGEHTNTEVTYRLLELLQRPESLVKHIEDPRGGAHDMRYSVDASKLRALGWKPEWEFDAALEHTVRWYVNQRSWWERIVLDPAYRAFVQSFYGKYLGSDL
jgi:dTDP-glucose 4,6-dehydratase